jgi:hypothetical protein
VKRLALLPVLVALMAPASAGSRPEDGHTGNATAVRLTVDETRQAARDAIRRVPSPASASGGPRLSAYDYVFKSLGEGDDDVDFDYGWRWRVTICTSQAARVNIRDISVNAETGDATGSSFFRKQKAGCTRHRVDFTGPNFLTMRSRLRLAWRGLHVKGPWRTATCQGCS